MYVVPPRGRCLPVCFAAPATAGAGDHVSTALGPPYLNGARSSMYQRRSLLRVSTALASPCLNGACPFPPPLSPRRT